jgi:hypothetical protein
MDCFPRILRLCFATILTFIIVMPSFAGSCITPDAAERAKKEVTAGSFVRLPEMAKRKVIGSWLRVAGQTTSIEQVANRYFMVSRTRFCDTGNQGWPLTKSGGQYLDANGDRYRIMHSGQLGVFDSQGPVDTYKMNAGVCPD